MILTVGLLVCSIVTGELTQREQAMAKAIQETVRRAGSSYAAGDYDHASQHLRSAMSQIEAATKDGSAELYEAIASSIARVSRARAMLEFEGVTLPPFKLPPKPASGPNTVKSSKKGPKVPVRESGSERVEFASDIAGLLVERCTGCHIDANPTRGQIPQRARRAPCRTTNGRRS